MAAGRNSTGISPRPMLMGAPRNALRAFNAGVSLCLSVHLVAHRLLHLFRGAGFVARLFGGVPSCGLATGVMAYPPTGSVQTECTRLPVMLRTKGRFLCQRTIGFVGL